MDLHHVILGVEKQRPEFLLTSIDRYGPPVSAVPSSARCEVSADVESVQRRAQPCHRLPLTLEIIQKLLQHSRIGVCNESPPDALSSVDLWVLFIGVETEYC